MQTDTENSRQMCACRDVSKSCMRYGETVSDIATHAVDKRRRQRVLPRKIGNGRTALGENAATKNTLNTACRTCTSVARVKPDGEAAKPREHGKEAASFVYANGHGELSTNVCMSGRIEKLHALWRNGVRYGDTCSTCDRFREYITPARQPEPAHHDT